MATSLRHSAAKRRRLAALDAAVSTIALPGLGVPNGISVLADGTRLVSKQNTITAVVVCTVAGQAPGKGQAGFINGGRENARFKDPSSVVVAANGNIILSDTGNHAIRVVTPEGSVRTLVGGQKGFADGQVGFGH
jgi:hypothetical protein